MLQQRYKTSLAILNFLHSDPARRVRSVVGGAWRGVVKEKIFNESLQLNNQSESLQLWYTKTKLMSNIYKVIVKPGKYSFQNSSKYFNYHISQISQSNSSKVYFVQSSSFIKITAPGRF